MKAKEKAQELFEKMQSKIRGCNYLINKFENARQCALITVDEILNLDTMNVYMDYQYWEEVKQEINKL